MNTIYTSFIWLFYWRHQMITHDIIYIFISNIEYIHIKYNIIYVYIWLAGRKKVLSWQQCNGAGIVCIKRCKYIHDTWVYEHSVSCVLIWLYDGSNCDDGTEELSFVCVCVSSPNQKPITYYCIPYWNCISCVNIFVIHINIKYTYMDNI